LPNHPQQQKEWNAQKRQKKGQNPWLTYSLSLSKKNPFFHYDIILIAQRYGLFLITPNIFSGKIF